MEILPKILICHVRFDIPKVVLALLNTKCESPENLVKFAYLMHIDSQNNCFRRVTG